MQSRVLYLPRTVKQLVVLSLDVVLALLSTWIAFTLRLDVLNWPSGAQWWVYMLAPVVAIPIFIRFGLYRAIFRYTGQAALQATGLAVLVYGCILTVILLWMQWPMVPRSLGVLQPLIFLFLVGASRALARFWLADLGHTSAQVGGRLLIYGAGTAGVQTAAALRMSQQYALLGFVDDDVSGIFQGIQTVTGLAVPHHDIVPSHKNQRLTFGIIFNTGFGIDREEVKLLLVRNGRRSISKKFIRNGEMQRLDLVSRKLSLFDSDDKVCRVESGGAGL